jgi:hypothetical protein
MRREESSFVTVLMKQTSPRLEARTTHPLPMLAQLLSAIHGTVLGDISANF